ncbi:MAG: PIG-L family deacetylase [Planctomycetota bacterium]
MAKDRKVAFAVAAHPDDIEFTMAGTLILLREKGYELHYMNVANGSCGTATHGTEEIIRIRTREARAAAALIGAIFHAPLVDDIDIFYEKKTLARMGAVMREVNPTILLVQSPEDYMEDHINSGRLAVSAAFCKGMRNFPTSPRRRPVEGECAIYHALPHGLMGPLRRRVRAGLYVDVSSVMKRKRAMLACHKSQKEWLDRSQGMDSYLITMEELCREVGKASKAFPYAEGWRRHSHWGFSGRAIDPLAKALGSKAHVDKGYEKELRE